MKIGLLFPGQGYQRLGILQSIQKKFPEIVDPIIERIDSSMPQLKLSQPLLNASPSDIDITPTEIAQPLILAASYTIYDVFRQQNPSKIPKILLGHSLGEYTALVAAGMLSLESALPLVHQRGLAMKRAGDSFAGPLGMILVAKPRRMPGEEYSNLITAIVEKYDVDVAGYNSASQTVFSGELATLNSISSDMKKPILTKLLKVSSAFHSRYMAPAQEKLRDILSSTRLDFNPEVQVISNVTGLPYASEEEIKNSCLEALVKPVLWKQSVSYAAASVDEFVSIGPGSIGKNTENEVKIKTEIFNND